MRIRFRPHISREKSKMNLQHLQPREHKKIRVAKLKKLDRDSPVLSVLQIKLQWWIQGGEKIYPLKGKNDFLIKSWAGKVQHLKKFSNFPYQMMLWIRH